MDLTSEHETIIASISIIGAMFTLVNGFILWQMKRIYNNVESFDTRIVIVEKDIVELKGADKNFDDKLKSCQSNSQNQRDYNKELLTGIKEDIKLLSDAVGDINKYLLMKKD